MPKYHLTTGVLLVLATATLTVSAQQRFARSDEPVNAGTSAADSSKTPNAFTDFLIAKEKSLGDAQKRKDLEYLKDITTDDFLDVGPDGKLYTKHDVLEAINQISLEDFSLYDVQVLPLSDKAALVTYNAIVHMTIGSEEAPRYQRLSSVWVNQEGKWLLKFQQATVKQ